MRLLPFCQRLPRRLLRQVRTSRALLTGLLPLTGTRLATSELAIGSAQDGEVRAFAEMMITDHTAAAEKMGAAAEADGITPAAEISAVQQARLNELESLTGERFDTAYIDVQSTAHDEAVALFRAFAEGEEESALRDFAQQTLPLLEQHQEHVRSLAAK